MKAKGGVDKKLKIRDNERQNDRDKFAKAKRPTY